MILISAGHHPEKPGACFEGFCEHDEAVRWVGLLCELLGEHKCVKVPTGGLKSKVAFINARAPTVALEVHFNSDPTHAGRGSETLYYPGSEAGRALAERMQSALGALLPPDRGPKEGWYRMNRKFGPDYFLAKTKCTAIIVEPEFIHNMGIIRTNRQKACELIAGVLLDEIA